MAYVIPVAAWVLDEAQAAALLEKPEGYFENYANDRWQAVEDLARITGAPIQTFSSEDGDIFYIGIYVESDWCINTTPRCSSRPRTSRPSTRTRWCKRATWPSSVSSTDVRVGVGFPRRRPLRKDQHPMIPVDTPVGTVCKLLKRWAENHDTAGNQHTLGDPDIPAGSLVTIHTEFNYMHYAFNGVHDPTNTEPAGGFGVRLHAFDYKGNPSNYHFAHPSVLALDIVTDEDVRAAFRHTFRFDEAEEATA